MFIHPKPVTVSVNVPLPLFIIVELAAPPDIALAASTSAISADFFKLMVAPLPKSNSTGCSMSFDIPIGVSFSGQNSAAAECDAFRQPAATSRRMRGRRAGDDIQHGSSRPARDVLRLTGDGINLGRRCRRRGHVLDKTAAAERMATADRHSPPRDIKRRYSSFSNAGTGTRWVVFCRSMRASAGKKARTTYPAKAWPGGGSAWDALWAMAAYRGGPDCI